MIKIFKNEINCNYKGLRIMANPDIHKVTAKEIEKLGMEKNSEILILGSGMGAFDQRLLDLGFKKITSADIIKSSYYLQNERTNFMQLDLNKSFHKHIGRKFDAIICLEIIEHLNNPYSFLFNCKKLLKEKGIILISTPNVHSYISRIYFLLFGYPMLFLDKPRNHGHISPIFENILEYHLALNDLEIIKIIPVSNFFRYVVIHSYKSYPYYLCIFLSSIFLLPFYIFSLNKIKGLLSLYIIKNK